MRDLLFFLADRHERNLRVLKIKGHSIVTEKIATKDSSLFEARSLIDRVEIKRDGGDTLSRMLPETDARQEEAWYIVSYAGGSNDTHLFRSYEGTDPVVTGDIIRDDGNARSCVNDKVQRLLDPFELHLATKKSA